MKTLHNKMTLTLPSDLEIQLSRTFDAPRALVFDVWTQAEHVRNWWGCDNSSMPVCDADVRPGGAYRYVLRMGDGSEFAFKGVYREVARPNRVVHTQIFDVEPWNNSEAIVTATFQESDGKTTVTETTLYPTVEARNAQLQSDMEQGAAQSLDRLEDYLHERQAQ